MVIRFLSEFLNHFGFRQSRTIRFEHQIIRFLCNFGLNSVEKFINTISDNWVRSH